MDFGRQVIRFSIPGGVFAFLLAFYLIVIRIAYFRGGALASTARTPEDRIVEILQSYRSVDAAIPLDQAQRLRDLADETSSGPIASEPLLRSVGTILDPLTSNVLVSIIGMIVVGLLIYQIYYVTYRPSPQLLWARPRWMQPRDRGGAILKILRLEPGAEDWIEEEFANSGDLEPVTRSEKRKDPQRKTWYRHNEIVRSLMSQVADSGRVHAKQDFDYRADMYHSLGACRVAVVLATAAALVYMPLAQYPPDWKVAELSLAAGLVIAIFSYALLWVIRKNRAKAWYALTEQAGHDLRVWFRDPDRQKTKA